MDDTLKCPICNEKFRTVYWKNKSLFSTGKIGNWAERTCNGVNHSIQIYSDVKIGIVDFIRLSLNHKYSKYLEIDFINQKCRIICMKEGKAEYIGIDKMIEPDFPSLEKLNEKIKTFLIFS